VCSPVIAIPDRASGRVTSNQLHDQTFAADDCSLLRVVESALRNENYPGLDPVHQPMFTVDPA